MEEQLLPVENNANHIGDLYKNWFLEYASYVILERAVPAIEDGLKPVQRRILHALKEMDDGRFNKVANVIGQTMQYHPHGDASITDAMVNIGQKELLIETQGNWGDIRTGDSAAAARYIEARLSKFAKEIAFNAKTTEWQLSYDGRKSEPVTLPMKFPLLLAQGAEGIAVGLSTKILPHNFCEIIEAAIKYLKGRSFELFPDFMTGGMVDVTHYNDGARGGKVRVRTIIEKVDNKTLSIKSVPHGTTTQQLIDSILKANDNGKIKIKSITDNTAKDIELTIQLANGVSPDQTIDALYLFTDCEVSISPNICIIVEDKPKFTNATELLKYSVDHTKALLLKELEIKFKELEDDWHYSSLEKIFIEKKIYRDIEEETTWEGVLGAINKGLKPYIKLFKRAIIEEDIIKLTEIKIKRISKFDALKADELLKGIEVELANVQQNISNLNDYTIAYYDNLNKKYGKGRERITEIKPFENIQAAQVAIANTKLYVNYKEGFIGTSLKKDEYAFECSDLDQIIVFRRDGKMMVAKVTDKQFMGKDLIHVAIFKKNDERTTYNMMYVDGKTGITMVKRFNVTGIIRDKEYDLTKGNSNSKINYFTANDNAESEIVTVTLHPGASARVKVFDYNFEDLEIKGRSAGGNQLTKYPVKSIKQKSKGKSTLGAKQLWYDAIYGRLNMEERGELLGRFSENDKLIAYYNDGTYEMTDTDLINKYDFENLIKIEKLNTENYVHAIYFEIKTKQYFAKKFKIETQTLKNRFLFIKEGIGNKLIWVSTNENPIILLKLGKKKSELKEEKMDFNTQIEPSGWKTIGTKLAFENIFEIQDFIENNIDTTTVKGTLF